MSPVDPPRCRGCGAGFVRHRPGCELVALRRPQPCTCPHGTRVSRDYGAHTVRLSTTPGCPEHDVCHGFTPDAVAERHRVLGTDIHPWCPVHESKGCPDAEARPRAAEAYTRPKVEGRQ